MLRTLFLALALLWPAGLYAACSGQDLIAALPDSDRNALVEAAEAQPYPNGMLWRATRGDEVVHLVGTMHFFDARHSQTFDQVRPWIDGAQTVFLELGEGDDRRFQRFIAENPSAAFITEGPTLPDLLSEDDWQLLRVALADRGVPGIMGAKMRPWMALVTLGLTSCIVQDVAAGRKGLDGMIMDYAAGQGNPAQGLENFDAALRIFDEFDRAEMLDFLRLLVRLENFDPDDQYHTLVEHYFREEIRVIWEFSVVQSLAQPQGMTEAEIRADYARLEEAMIYQRNRAWMDRILPAAAAGPVFVGAGALHLPGEDGLLRLLESEGFTVTRVARN